MTISKTNIINIFATILEDIRDKIDMSERIYLVNILFKYSSSKDAESKGEDPNIITLHIIPGRKNSLSENASSNEKAYIITIKKEKNSRCKTF